MSYIVESEGGSMATKSVPLSARISPKLSADLSRLSRTSERSKSRIVTDALRAYVESETEFAASIERARRDFKEGRFKEHSVFMAELRKKYAKKR
jgi:predicted transcriptional regulator